MYNPKQRVSIESLVFLAVLGSNLDPQEDCRYIFSGLLKSFDVSDRTVAQFGPQQLLIAAIG